MPYQATVFNVLIASPGDVQVERNIVRDVINEWNAIHSPSRGIVFQPIGWETHSHPAMGGRPQGVLNDQILKHADLLVAIFWTRLGTPTGEAPSGSVEEIERHVAAGKPAMVYFSSAPVRLDSVDDEQYRALVTFKEQCKRRGLVETYDSQTDFRQKLARQLASKVNNDTYFAKGTPGVVVAPIPDRPVPEVSEEAKKLLLTARDDKDGLVLRVSLLSGVEIQTNGKQFVERGNPRSEAAWDSALKQLTELGLLEDRGHKGEVYRVTAAGYEMADLFQT
jgi:hypothetical protein